MPAQLDRGRVVRYFLLAFTISWAGAGALLLAAYLERGTNNILGLLTFPAMLLGPPVAGLLAIREQGPGAALQLWRRVIRVRLQPQWYAVLLLPPALVFATLEAFSSLVSPGFRPNHFYPGAWFGLVAGFFEELGWMGFAYPRLSQGRSALHAAVVLGLFWAVWHIPAINYLGAKAPHGSMWLPYFLAFTLVMVAMRILIAWIYTNTGSVFLTQLMHASSTGALVVLSPAKITPGEEVLWYLAYGTALWGVVLLVVQGTGRKLSY